MYNLVDIFIISMVTYALSSAWLFSPGLIGFIREQWIYYWSGKGFSLEYLGICQLCSGFWFGVITCIIFYNDFNILRILLISLMASVFSWTFGSITNAFLWHKAMVEQEYEYNRKYRNV